MISQGTAAFEVYDLPIQPAYPIVDPDQGFSDTWDLPVSLHHLEKEG